MLIVDEIAFTIREEIETLNKSSRVVYNKGKRFFFGGIHAVFTGDFFNVNQLDLNLFSYIQYLIYSKNICVHLWS